MGDLFHVTILSSGGKVFEGDLRSLTAPGELGYLGVLANHAPLMTTLKPGRITLRDESGNVTRIDAKSGGFLEISSNKAAILLDQEGL